MDLITAVLAILMLGIVMIYFLTRRNYNLPPGPKGYPLIGNLHEMMSKRPNKPLYKYLAELSKTHGDIFTFSAGFGKQVHMIMLNNADSINQALVKQIGQFDSRPPTWSLYYLTKSKDILMGDPSDPVWKLSRKLATSGFRNLLSGTRLDSKVHCSVEKGIELLSDKSGQPINIKNVLNLIVYNVICDMVFGTRFEFDDKKFQYLYTLVDKLDEQFSVGILEDIIPLWQYSPIRTSFTKNVMKMMDQLLEYISNQVEEHQSKYNPDNISDLIEYLIKAKEQTKQDDPDLAAQFTNERIVQVTSDVFFAGTDTSTHTLYWLMYFMAKHPEIQAKVQVEIDEAVGTLLPKITDKQNMVYCEAVLYETMRIQPVAPMGFFHSPSLENAKLNGYDIPGNAQVITNIWACHHDAREWENPDEFNPERFIHEDGSLIAKPKSWLPFSAGRRACIGENVAKHEIFIIFSGILQKFDVRFADESLKSKPIQYLDNGFLCSPEPFEVIVTPRL